jgi:hypothetical protein
MLKVNGKSKLKHFLYDLGYRNALAVTLFCVCLFFALSVPLIMPFACILFWIAYLFDKYNLIFISELSMDSLELNRQTLIIYSVVGILLFQFGFIYTISTLLTRRVIIYLGVFFCVELILVIITFEFFRKPWKGKKTKNE